MSKEPVYEELMQESERLEDFSGIIRPNIFLFYGIVLASIWTLIIIGSLMWNIQREQKNTRELAKREARTNFNKDQAFRSWGASHGGVYVPVDEKTPPNPYLSHILERDIKTPSGKLLTLMNPAYMIRQLMEDYSDEYGIRGHITSLKLLRPENAPDEWERKALESFEKGIDEVSEFTEIGGEPYLRLMRPMITKKECLKCHRYQGYKVGDVRGGVGISLPMSNLLSLERETINILYLSHGLILLLGLGGIWLATKRIKQSMLKHYQAEEKLKEYRLHLEDLVKKRTAELSRVNDQFKKEITERKEIEDNLLKEKSFSETAINSLPGIFYLVDEQGNILRHNKNLKTVTGYSDKEISKLNALDFFTEENRETVAEKIQEVLEEGETTLEADLLTKDGKKIPYFFTGSLMDAGNKKYIVGMGIDLTERKWAEIALQESENKYHDLYDNAPDMFVSVDAKTAQILECNRTLVQATGYTREEIIGRPVFDFYHSDCLDEAKKTFKQFIKNGEVNDAELQIKRKDGTKIDVRLNVSAVRDVHGNILQSRSILRDITKRKWVESELFKQQYFLAKAQEMGKIGTWELDTRKNILVWTEENYRIFGLPIGTPLTYETFLDCVYPDDRKYVDKKWKAALNKKPYDIEHRLLMKDGSIKWVREKAELEFDEQGNCVRGTGFTQDITERKKVEETMRLINESIASETGGDFLRSLAKQLAMSLGARYAFVGEVVTPEIDRIRTIAVWADGDYADNFEYELAGTPCANVVKQNFCAYSENIQQYFPDDHLLSEMGAESYVGIKLVNSAGNMVGILVSLHDKPMEDVLLIKPVLTTFALRAAAEIERKQAEEKLKESEERFRIIFEQAAVGVAQVLIETGHYLRINKRYCDIVGYSPEEMLGLTFQDITHPEDLQADLDNKQKVREGKINKFSMEKRYIRKDGSPVWVNLTVSPMWEVGEQPNYYIAVVEDINDRKRAEEEIKELNKNLEKRVHEEVEKSRQKDYIMIKQSRLAAMGEMIRFITHQWGQPLWALQLLFHNIEDLIEDSGINTEDTDELIANGFDLVKRMFTTMNDFKTFFQADKKKVTFSLNKNIKDTLSMIGASFKYSNIPIHLNEKEELTVLGFPNEFSQVILNILKNAKDAILEKGVDGEIKIDFLGKGDTAIVRIKDNGGGIPEEILDKIFDSYFTTKKEDKGTGIGLYLSKIIIEDRMGGRINVRNTKKGVEFEIKLPLIRS